MILNPKIVEVFIEQANNWVVSNIQNLEPGDIIRFWENPKELTVHEGCKIFVVQELPNIPCSGMTDEAFGIYLKEVRKKEKEKVNG